MFVWTHTQTHTHNLSSTFKLGIWYFSEPRFPLCLSICLFWIQICLFSSVMSLQFIISLVFHGSALSSVPETPRVVRLVLPFERLQLFPISTRFPPPLRRAPALYRSWSPSCSLWSDSVPTLPASDCQLPPSSWRRGSFLRVTLPGFSTVLPDKW